MDDKIFITEKDYLRLKTLLENIPELERENLEIEIERAVVLPDDEVPAELVTMNSTIKYKDLSNGKEKTVTITYPGDKRKFGKNISIMAPLGSALIGLSKEQEINWKFPDGQTRRLKVLSANCQPEANNDWYL